MTPHYRAPWFLALGHLSKGVGWTAHDAALSWLRDNGQQRLPRYALTSALAGIPSGLHKIAVGALLMVGLWAETPEGYEVRGAPAPERSTPAALMQQASRESERERAAARSLAPTRPRALQPILKETPTVRKYTAIPDLVHLDARRAEREVHRGR
jgi:hypothetical protein